MYAQALYRPSALTTYASADSPSTLPGVEKWANLKSGRREVEEWASKSGRRPERFELIRPGRQFGGQSARLARVAKLFLRNGNFRLFSRCGIGSHTSSIHSNDDVLHINGRTVSHISLFPLSVPIAFQL